jgi:TIR domain
MDIDKEGSFVIKFEFNGNPFNPQNFTETLLKAAMENIAAQMHDKVSAIRHPVTGEFPTIVVSGTSLENISLRIEGSPELLSLVNERLGTTQNSDSEIDPERVEMTTPRVFLSYAWEDKDVASRIAHALQKNGIDTWWAEWCISAGDSLRQKIDEGLGDCTHFVVLLTSNSIVKPWVNLEMDAGLMLKLQSQVKFIPLRHQLSAEQLPPLLRGMYSPAVENPEQDINQLINDIHGVTKKPALGKAPMAVVDNQFSSTGFSAAANAIAKVFVQATKHAKKFDPWFRIDELTTETGLSREDVIDAVHELQGMVAMHSEGTYFPESELFATFDRLWMPWNPIEDGLSLAADMLNAEDFPCSPKEIAERYGWDARRLNPAMAYLVNRKLVQERTCLNTGDWLVYTIGPTDETRRFVKGRR